MTVPIYNEYFPSEEKMDSKQRAYYYIVKTKLQKGEYIEVEGNIAYVFVFIYDLLSNWEKTGFENLCEYLIYISEIYNVLPKLSEYCLFWAYDCLLGLKKYEEYIDKTEPNILFGTLTHQSNLRLNIQKHLGLEANPVDILLMAGGRKSKFIESNPALYKVKIQDVFMSFSKDYGNWFDIFDRWIPDKLTYAHYLFQGAPLLNSPKLSFNLLPFYSIKNLDKIIELQKVAENQARKECGLPQIGEGWISETTLFRKIQAEFSMTTVIQHGQPTWLGKQHFDIWIPNWKIAIEYHGLQHFEPVEFFGGKKAFEKNLERDKRKADLAKRHGVKLLIVVENDDQEKLIQDIYHIVENRKIMAPYLR